MNHKIAHGLRSKPAKAVCACATQLFKEYAYISFF